MGLPAIGTPSRRGGALTRMDKLFAPQWAGGWTVTRWLYAFVGLSFHAPRIQWIEDAYVAHDFLYSAIGARQEFKLGLSYGG